MRAPFLVHTWYLFALSLHGRKAELVLWTTFKRVLFHGAHSTFITSQKLPRNTIILGISFKLKNLVGGHTDSDSSIDQTFFLWTLFSLWGLKHVFWIRCLVDVVSYLRAHFLWQTELLYVELIRKVVVWTQCPSKIIQFHYGNAVGKQ